ncbi:hypothetical protein [Blastomonas sp.]|uniref:hypothetical protein n=1 Tax=Blastomonas sp. TaxID=1909299 RepID=UPI0026387538|nr:hypothetical protein [Blastomonas sp.]MDM7956419.1 hypothetical protein [Blastomonas sp.]
MNDKFSDRVSAMGDDPSQTDWARLRAMTDDDIEAAIEADDGTFALTPDDLQADGPGFKFALGDDNLWHWRFYADSGKLMAQSGIGYPNTLDAIAAADEFRSIIAKAA